MDWKALSEQFALRLTSLSETPEGQIYFTKHLVPNSERLGIHVYANEHAPPHFCLKYNEHVAVYKIEVTGDLYRLEGSMPKSIEKKLKYLYEDGFFRTLLINTWNETRPYNCPVGPIIID